MAIYADEKELSAYVQALKAIPHLEDGEVFRLGRRVQEQDDQEAFQRLVESHLLFVVKIAYQYKFYTRKNGGQSSIEMRDLIGEGNIGLVKAVKKYDPTKGFQLAGFARNWIRAEINEFVVAAHSAVAIKLLPENKKLFFGLSKTMNALGIDAGNVDLTPEAVAKIAEHLKVHKEGVVMMHRRLRASDASLNMPICAGADEEAFEERGHRIVDEVTPTPEDAVMKTFDACKHSVLLRAAIAGLEERARDILISRRMRERPLSHQELAKKYGISRERVRQLEVKAFNQVQQNVKNAVAKLAEAGLEWKASRGETTLPQTAKFALPTTAQTAVEPARRDIVRHPAYALA